MKNDRYKILVLSDLKDSAISTLKNAIGLSKIIGADIDFFYVKKPTEIVETFSQLSAMRSINRECINTENKIQKIVSSSKRDFDVNIKTSFSFGNVKKELEDKINNVQPDIVVLGKRKYKTLKFAGDNITEFVLKVHNGPVMMASVDYGIEPNKELTLGIYNKTDDTLNFMFAEDLLSKTKQPIKTFNIVETSNKQLKVADTNITTLDYVFEKNDISLKKLSSYLVKNDVNLLCVSRDDVDYKKRVLKSKVSDVVEEVNVSVLITK